MTEFQVTSWRDIPSMVASRDGDEIVKIPLHQRCQDAIDEAVAAEALAAAVPAMYTDPVDAEVAFDADSTAYVVTPGVDGTGVDAGAVRESLATAFAAGETTIEVDAVASPVSPERETYVADATAARLNTMLDEAGFYVGDERVVPIEASTLASWITLSPGERGTLDIAVDESAVQEGRQAAQRGEAAAQQERRHP